MLGTRKMTLRTEGQEKRAQWKPSLERWDRHSRVCVFGQLKKYEFHKRKLDALDVHRNAE